MSDRFTLEWDLVNGEQQNLYMNHSEFGTAGRYCGYIQTLSIDADEDGIYEVEAVTNTGARERHSRKFQNRTLALLWLINRASEMSVAELPTSFSKEAASHFKKGEFLEGIECILRAARF